MEIEFKTLIISALLHNISNFAKRANRPFSGDVSSEEDEYVHYFVENDLPLPPELSVVKNQIANLASAISNASSVSSLKTIINISEMLAGGSGRKKGNNSESTPNRLGSVFEQIELCNHAFRPPGNYFYKLAPMGAGSESVFPVAGSFDSDQETYQALFDKFLSDLNKIDVKTEFKFYLSSLISVLGKYTWCIPSAFHDSNPCVSLYDHSVTTASIAQALYIFHKESGSVPAVGDKNAKFLLMAGDLSGIQNYIFRINKSSGRGVSKIFRARSFYLQALTRSVILSIQQNLDLTPMCRLIDSGGKFVLLLPFTSDTMDKIETIDSNIQLWFRKRFKGELTMNLSCLVSASQEDLLTGNFLKKIDELNEALQNKKLQKLSGALKAEGPVIHENYNDFEGGTCSLCKVNAADEDSSKEYSSMYDVDTNICQECYEQINYIGTKLPYTDYLIYKNSEDSRVGVSLFDNIKLELSRNCPENTDDLSNILHIESLCDSCNFARTRIARHLPKVTNEELSDEKWMALLSEDEEGVIQDLKPDQPKTFNMIAKKSKKRTKDNDLKGRPLLGFYKADVDNLGLIFSMGLEESLSPAMLASLSRMMDIFFSEYIIELAKKEYPDIYAVFAGGDDLFMVGPWNHVLDFAIKMREQFSLYCAGNRDITLSGGILIAKPRLPVRKAVELAEEYLGHAKNNPSKNSLHILGETVSWEEIKELRELGVKFDKAVEEKETTFFSTSFLHRLLEYHRMYKLFTADKNKKIRFGKYLSLAHYDIGRNIVKEKANNQKELEMLYEIFAVGVTEKPKLDKLNIPLFYAINQNRK